MKKTSKIRFCNAGLMATGLLALLSSIQMEACGGNDPCGLSFVSLACLHAAVGTVMLSLVVWHLQLHFGSGGWLFKIKQLKKRPTKMLCVLFAVTVVSCFMAIAHFIAQETHAPVGAIHGKIGFLFLLFCLGHTVKRRAWVKTQLLKKTNAKHAKNDRQAQRRTAPN